MVLATDFMHATSAAGSVELAWVTPETLPSAAMRSSSVALPDAVGSSTFALCAQLRILGRRPASVRTSAADAPAAWSSTVARGPFATAGPPYTAALLAGAVPPSLLYASSVCLSRSSSFCRSLDERTAGPPYTAAGRFTAVVADEAGSGFVSSEEDRLHAASAVRPTRAPIALAQNGHNLSETETCRLHTEHGANAISRSVQSLREMIEIVLACSIVAGAFLFFSWRTLTIFHLSVRGREVLVVRGRIPPPLLDEIREIARIKRTLRGTIRAVKDGGLARIACSGGIDPDTEQRLRNVLGRFPIAKLRSARPIANPTLGQRLGIEWLAWRSKR